MKPKLPPDAFGFYAGLGSARSYAAVAAHFGVSRRTVASTGARDCWVARVAQIDRQARERAMERATKKAISEQARRRAGKLLEPVAALDVLDVASAAKQALVAGETKRVEELLDEIVHWAQREVPLAAPRDPQPCLAAAGGRG